MNEKQLRTIVGNLRRVIGPNSSGPTSDAQLLERYRTLRDELAFEMLVWRHGSMVLNVCRRVLRDNHAAEDAFQATFLIFVRKLGSIGKSAAVGSWLYKVAFRVALRARQRDAGRRTDALPDDERLPGGPAFDDPAQRALWHDLRPVLDEEVNRLPEKYRTPFILFYLEGMPYPEVAQELGCPKGTVSSRLTAAKGLLRKRLLRRGVALSAALFGVVLAKAASAAITVDLTCSTMQTMRLVAGGGAAKAAASARAVILAEGVLRTMMLTKMKLTAAILLAVAALGFGSTLAIQHAVSAEQPTDGSSLKPTDAAPPAPTLQPPVEVPDPPATPPLPVPPNPYGQRTPPSPYGSPTPPAPVPLPPASPPPPVPVKDALSDRLTKIEDRLAKLETEMAKLQAPTHRLPALPKVEPPAPLQPPATSPPPVSGYSVTKPKLKLPFKVAPDAWKNIASISLFVSDDQGKSWKEAVRINDNARDAFDFNAPHDGEYWFKLRVMDKEKHETPETLDRKTEPDLKVTVVSPKADDADAQLAALEAQLRFLQDRIKTLKAKQEPKPLER